jgi:hypothetical protein
LENYLRNPVFQNSHQYGDILFTLGKALVTEIRTPRIDTSDHVWFVNDQLAVRFIEEIDFDYAADDATAVLLTAPAGPA